MKGTAPPLLVHNHKLLLHLRDEKHPDPNLRNKWGLVGGGVEPNEKALTGILREIKEETNLEPKELKYFTKLVIDGPDQKLEASIFGAHLSDDEVKHLKLGDEGREIKFFATNEIANLHLAPEVRKYYEAFKSAINKYINEGVIQIQFDTMNQCEPGIVPQR